MAAVALMPRLAAIAGRHHSVRPTKTDAKDIITNELLDEAIKLQRECGHRRGQGLCRNEQPWGAAARSSSIVEATDFCCAIATFKAAGRSKVDAAVVLRLTTLEAYRWGGRVYPAQGLTFATTKGRVGT
jgi:hypothetical protein